MREREEFIARVARAGGTVGDARAILRAAKTLHRLAEEECGDSNAYQSWAREECEECGGSHLRIYPYTSNSYWRHGTRCTQDRTRYAERNARAKVEQIAQKLGATVEFQGDPRGPVVRLRLKGEASVAGVPS